METESAARTLSFQEYLGHLVQHELPKRGSRAVERRIKAAGFPAIYRLEEYDSKRMAKSTRSFSSSFTARLDRPWGGRGPERPARPREDASCDLERCGGLPRRATRSDSGRPTSSYWSSSRRARRRRS